jgi:hypothetical protein
VRLSEPFPAVDELAGCVEVTGVAGGFGDHVKEDRTQALKQSGRPEFVWPQGRGGIQCCGGDDGIGEFDLLPVGVEHGAS